MAFEEEFGVEIPDDQAETITTVGDAVKFLEKASAAAEVTPARTGARSAQGAGDVRPSPQALEAGLAGAASFEGS